MDISNPASLMAGVLVGCVGAGLFIFGKKQARPIPMVAGIALSVLPMVVPSILALCALTAACLGGMCWIEKHA